MPKHIFFDSFELIAAAIFSSIESNSWFKMNNSSNEQ